MSNLYAVLLFVAVCLACDLDLHYRVNNGDYLIVNPDSDTYNGIQAFDASGDECTTAVIEVYGFTVTGCGLVSIKHCCHPIVKNKRSICIIADQPEHPGINLSNAYVIS